MRLLSLGFIFLFVLATPRSVHSVGTWNLTRPTSNPTYANYQSVTMAGEGTGTPNAAFTIRGNTRRDAGYYNYNARNYSGGTLSGNFSNVTPNQPPFCFGGAPPQNSLIIHPSDPGNGLHRTGINSCELEEQGASGWQVVDAETITITT